MADKFAQIEAEAQVDETYDTSDKEAVNKVRKKAARTRADRLKFIEAGMNLAEGRAYFYDFLVRCHIFNRSFDQDPYVHAYKAGEVNIGLMLLDDIQTIAPSQYITMVSENKTKNG